MTIKEIQDSCKIILDGLESGFYNSITYGRAQFVFFKTPTGNYRCLNGDFRELTLEQMKEHIPRNITLIEKPNDS